MKKLGSLILAAAVAALVGCAGPTLQTPPAL
jgi:hypothetical protein